MMKQHSKIRIFKNGGSLSETDLNLLAATDTVLNMMRNRIVVVINSSDDIEWPVLTDDIKGLYHIRPLDKAKSIYQIWFETPEDLERFEKNTMIHKISTSS